MIYTHVDYPSSTHIHTLYFSNINCYARSHRFVTSSDDRDAADFKLKRVYLIWICNEIGAFSWFNHVLENVDEQLRSTVDLLHYR